MDVSAHTLVVVEELDLTAVAPARRHVVRASFERELARLAAEPGWVDRVAGPGPREEIGHGPLEQIGGVGERSGRRASAGTGVPPMALGVPVDGNPVVVGIALARAVARAAAP